MKKISIQILSLSGIILLSPVASYNQNLHIGASEKAKMHHEIPDDKYLPPSADRKTSNPAPQLKSSGFFTKQVNVDLSENNILGDAANEPSIAVDPVNPNHILIGWRQFDNVISNFRQAGYGYSTDGGQNWTFPGVLEPTIFRSDPVLDFDSAGNFYYNSLTNATGAYTCKVFKSADGGASWDIGTDAHGGDKQWMVIDRTNNIGAGNIYSFWTQGFSSCQPGFFTRSTNGGASYETCVQVDGSPYWGTMAVGPDGELYVAGTGSFNGIGVAQSYNAQIPGSEIFWNFSTNVDIDGVMAINTPINPAGLLGQANIGVDRSNGPGRGNVYVLASVQRLSTSDPGDVMFAKSTDGMMTWSAPLRLNNDGSNSNYQWLATMSVAPNGRIDVAWLDTRDAPAGSYLSALYYCYSDDQGETWSINKKLSNLFDPQVGYPQQDKMGDYFCMVSDNEGAHLAWANTLNGEEDVYYTHIIPTIVGIGEEQEYRDLVSMNIYPNPFRDHAVINYKIQCDCLVKVEILTIYGVVVRSLVDRRQSFGSYSVKFNEDLLPQGFYLCRLSAGVQTETRQLIKFR